MATDRFSLTMSSLSPSETFSIPAFLLPFVVNLAGFLYAAFGFTLSVIVITTQFLLSHLSTIDSSDKLVKSLEDLRRHREQTLLKSAAERPIIQFVADTEHANQEPACLHREPEVVTRNVPNCADDDQRQGFKKLTLRLRPKLSRSRSSPTLTVPKLVLHLPSPPPSPPAFLTENRTTTHVNKEKRLQRMPTAPGSLHDMATKGNNFFTLKNNILLSPANTRTRTGKKKRRSASPPTYHASLGLLAPPA